MVSVSMESRDESERRLLQVIKQAEIHFYDTPFCFREFPLGEFPGSVNDSAVALVRDDASWSQLVPLGEEDSTSEAFGLFSVHFPNRADNSGFVGWLATHLKEKFGTGVFVVCGYSARRGGIYDYWGYPHVLADEVFAEMRRLSGRDRVST